MSNYVAMTDFDYGAYLAHHGILGQKWGIRRFQNKDGTWTEAGKKRRSIGNNKDRVERKLDKREKQYEEIRKRSQENEQRSLKKRRADAADFYKKQTEDTLKNIDATKKMAELYKTLPDKKRKTANLISLVSRKPLRDIADSELNEARKLLANAVSVDDRLNAKNREDRAYRMYDVASRKKPQYKNYYK